MKKRNSVKIGKGVNESVVVAGNGNNVVSGNKIIGNNNKIIIIAKQLIKPHFIIPALILVLAGLYLIQKPPVNVNITNVPSVPTKEEAKPTLNSFKEGIYGIIVAQFNGNTEEQKNKGKEIQSTIQSTLNARFKELGINDADARKTPILFESHDQARDFGKKYQSQLVIWGDVTLQGIIPNITIVNQEDTISKVFKPETTILKDSLCHVAMAQIKDIRFPALTDEPTKLVSFVTAMKYYDQDSYEKAAKYFTYSLPEYSDKYIDSSIILLYRGNTQLFMKKYQKASVDYTQAIFLNPKNDAAYNNRGYAYYFKGEYDKAISDYSQAIFLNPKDDAAYNNRGNTYYDKGEYDKAISNYSQAISLNSKNYALYNNRGNAYTIKGIYEKAIADYTQAISLNPKDDAAYNNRGIAYRNKGEYDKVIANYLQVISLNPKDNNVYNDISWLLATCPDDKYRNGAKAIEFAQKALALEPNDYAILDTLAAAYAEAGRFEDAVTTQESAISLLAEKDKDKEISEYKERLNFYKARKPWREKPSQKSNIN